MKRAKGLPQARADGSNWHIELKRTDLRRICPGATSRRPYFRAKSRLTGADDKAIIVNAPAFWHQRGMTTARQHPDDALGKGEHWFMTCFGAYPGCPKIIGFSLPKDISHSILWDIAPPRYRASPFESAGRLPDERGWNG